MIGLLRYIGFILVIAVTITTFLPFAALRPFNTNNNRLLFKYFRFLVETFLFMEIIIEGEENLTNNHPCIVIGNHQHNYDAYTVTKFFAERLVVLGKFELGLIPVFGWTYALSGNLLIKRSNKKKAMASMDAIEKRLKDEGLSILIFPEGHRNTSDELLPFKKGAYYTAVNTGLPLIPFSMSQYLKLNKLNSLSKLRVFVKVHPPIKTEGMSKEDIPRLVEQSRNIITKGIQEMNTKHEDYLNRN